jgi:hypothetical protein
MIPVTTLYSSKVDFSVEHFLKVMELWIKEPETVSKPILRADILSDHPISPSHRSIKRKLLPRNYRIDSELLQCIDIIDNDQGKL